MHSRVQVLADHLQRVLELDEPPHGEIFALDGDDHLVRGGQGVDRQQSQARRRVDADEVVVVDDRRQGLLQRALPPDLHAHRDLGSGQVDRGHGDVDLALVDHLADRDVVDEHVVHAPLDLVGIDPLAHRQVALRVEVDGQDLVAGLRECDGQVQGRRRLCDAALLVRERDDLRPALRLVAERGARRPAGAGTASRRQRVGGADSILVAVIRRRRVDGRRGGRPRHRICHGCAIGRRVVHGLVRRGPLGRRGGLLGRKRGLLGHGLFGRGRLRRGAGCSGSGSSGRAFGSSGGMAPSSGRWPFADGGLPFVDTFDLKPRLKRPIDRAYSHVILRFLPMKRDPRRRFIHGRYGVCMFLRCPSCSTSAW